MNDAMQVAQQRRKDYNKAIEAKETEISELRELIADLDSFIEFGEALVGKGAAAQVTELPKPAPTPTPAPTVTVTSKDADADEEWTTEDADKGVAQVLAARNG